MTKKCANRGCQKWARGGTGLCATHSGEQAIKQQPLTTKSHVAPQIATHGKGCFRTFTLSQDFFLSVQSYFSSTVIPKLDQLDFSKHGRRQLLSFTADQRKVLDPVLLSVVALSKTEVHFPLNSWKIQTPNIVVAPAKSAFSNSWTKGLLHRAFLDKRTSGVCTFMIFIDEVNQANGSVEIWTDSQWIPFDKKKPQRAMAKSGLQAQLLQGPPGTVVVFDSRILHRSLPNTTQNRRLTLLWNVSSEDGIETIETDEHPTLA
jgi:ectoine hydroxylase-related dioxygenase (phytanoyl-CoA dioxygenase family)